MDIEERSIRSTAGNVEEIIDTDEENLAISSSSAAEAAFDAAIGFVEDIIMENEFQQLQQSFMEKYYSEFDDSDENKLTYTAIFNEYVNLLEKHLEQQLMERIPDFNMNTFIQLLMQHKEEVPADIFDMLLSFTDFITFKEMFLEYRAEKEGRGLDLGQGLVVTSLTSSHQKYFEPSKSQ
uniref:ADP-ribosylation factor-like protein 2-binding protein n=1 Tax=Neogobius melanostomus TaxID=47308 RepID=A0A8C6SUX2_9GOBI